MIVNRTIKPVALVYNKKISTSLFYVNGVNNLTSQTIFKAHLSSSSNLKHHFGEFKAPPFNSSRCQSNSAAVVKNNSSRTTRNENCGADLDLEKTGGGSGGEEIALKTPRVLITGALGQLGQGLAKILRRKYGRENVLMSDIVKPDKKSRLVHDPYLYVDILDEKCLNSTIVNYQIDWLIHFSAILSAVGENNVPKALKINVEGVNNVLEAARHHDLRVFIPSTIGAFGTTSPRVNTPDVTIQRPNTIYGVSKVYNELLGEYYKSRFDVDFRCLRLPGVISGDTQPGGGTTDYAVQIFHDALNTGHYTCYLKPDTRLPMIYVDDCLRAISEFMEIDEQHLNLRTYNITSLSFTPEELCKAIQRKIPLFKLSYKICPVRQAIADSWPKSLDDSGARRDWSWAPKLDLNLLVDRMLQVVQVQNRKCKVASVENAKVLASA